MHCWRTEESRRRSLRHAGGEMRKKYASSLKSEFQRPAHADQLFYGLITVTFPVAISFSVRVSGWTSVWHVYTTFVSFSWKFPKSCSLTFISSTVLLCLGLLSSDLIRLWFSLINLLVSSSFTLSIPLATHTTHLPHPPQMSMSHINFPVCVTDYTRHKTCCTTPPKTFWSSGTRGVRTSAHGWPRRTNCYSSWIGVNLS